MRVTFIDPPLWNYDCETPLREPLGGTQSGVCYLSAELAARGVSVSVVNGVANPREVRAVHFAGADHLRADFLNEADVVVVVSHADAPRYRDQFGIRKPMVLWAHHAPDQHPILGLRDRASHAAWSRIVLLSEWQRQAFTNAFGIDQDRISILRNAVGPSFLEAPPRPWFETGAAPTFVYSSTPYRGLAPLLLMFPTIRKALPKAELRVFSSLAVYRKKEDEDPHRYLYEVARSLPGVHYEGSVAQPDLAKAMQNAAALTYPSVFAETSCIGVMEALATGADVISTAFGAIPETSAGFARLMNLPRENSELINQFSSLVVQSIRDTLTNPGVAKQRREARLAYARQHLTWGGRAAEWITMLESLKLAR
jgi:glycosyltransferase involved in cell wall biosynthesis